MEPQALLQALHVAERLKDVTRHCHTSGGRHESTAEHSWRLALMAYWLRDDFPELDMDKVVRMCLIHDLGEAFTGDIPSFLKTVADEAREEDLLFAWVRTLPEPFRGEMDALYREMAARDYADYPLTRTDGASLWGPKETAGSARAALCLREGNGVTIWELTGPAEELERLIPLLTAAFGAED